MLSKRHLKELAVIFTIPGSKLPNRRNGEEGRFSRMFLVA
jgi:hypothetical protein